MGTRGLVCHRGRLRGVTPGLAAQDRHEGIEQLGAADGLGDQRVGAARDGAVGGAGADAAGDDDCRALGARAVGDELGQVHARDARGVAVGDHHGIGLRAPQAVQLAHGLVAGRRGCRLAAPGAQVVAEGTAGGAVAVHDQDAQAAHLVGARETRRRRAGDAVEGQPHVEGAAPPHLTLHADGPAHHVHELAADGQAQPRAFLAAPRAAVGLPEGLEDAGLVLRRDPDAGVADPEPQPVVLVLLPLLVGQDHHLALLGELHGIAQQIDEDLAQAVGVTPHQRRHTGPNVADQLQPLARGHGGHCQRRGLHHQPHIEGRFRQLQPTGLDLREIQDVVDQRQQCLRGLTGNLQEASLFTAQVGVQGQAQHADDAVEGGADLMGHLGQEGALGLVAREGVFARVHEIRDVLEGLDGAGDVALLVAQHLSVLAHHQAATVLGPEAALHAADALDARLGEQPAALLARLALEHQAGPAHHFGAGVAGRRRKGFIDVGDGAIGTDDHDRGRGRLQDGLLQAADLPHLIFRPLAVGNVVHRHNDVVAPLEDDRLRTDPQPGTMFPPAGHEGRLDLRAVDRSAVGQDLQDGAPQGTLRAGLGEPAATLVLGAVDAAQPGAGALANDLPGVPQHRARDRRVGVRDHGVLIQQDHAHRRGGEDGLEIVLLGLQRRLGALAVRDVPVHPAIAAQGASGVEDRHAAALQHDGVSVGAYAGAFQPGEGLPTGRNHAEDPPHAGRFRLGHHLEGGLSQHVLRLVAQRVTHLGADVGEVRGRIGLPDPVTGRLHQVAVLLIALMELCPRPGQSLQGVVDAGGQRG